MTHDRRDFLRVLGASAATALGGCVSIGGKGGKVVVIGGGYGGATVAKHLRMWSSAGVDVTLVEPNQQFISCPLSNLVLGGSMQIADVSRSYDDLSRSYGVKLVRDTVTAIDPDKRTIWLSDGQILGYDRLVVSPGIDFLFDDIPGLNNAAAQDKILHAWKAGVQTVALRKQLEAMPDGGVYAISIPLLPFRCPPAPYERACQVASYFKKAKRRSKVLILDGNDDITSKKELFSKIFLEQYQGIVEYHNNHVLIDVDVRTSTAIFEMSDPVRADVLNVVPPQSAGAIAVRTGLATANKRWCEVDFLTFESIAVKHIHVLGDALQVAPLMPKSGHMANQQAKVCAAAIINLLAGKPINPAPVLDNVCYSFVNDEEAIHLSSIHQYNAEKQTVLVVPGSAKLSPRSSKKEGNDGFAWAQNIWADMLG